MTDSDRGAITAFVATLVVAFVACAALAVDGGRLVGARVTAADHAENAARAGAQELTGLRTGERVLDLERARRRASAYLAQQGVAGTVVVSPQSVTVSVRLEFRPTMLALVGVGPRPVSATRSAAPFSEAPVGGAP